MELAAILAAAQTLLAAAPKIADGVKAVKDYFDALFKADLITKDQQQKIHSEIDRITEQFANGQVPEGWAVEP